MGEPRTQRGPSTLDREVALALENERLRVMRRRVIWYCGVAMAALGAVAFDTLNFVLGPGDATRAQLQAATLRLTCYFVLFCIYALALTLVWALRPGRRRLVRILSWLTVIASSVAMLALPLAKELDLGFSGSTWVVGGIGVAAALALHLVGSLLIALSPKEGVRVLLPTWGVFAAIALFLYEGDWWVRALLVAAFPLAGLPGLGWSWWRYRTFEEWFRSKALAGQYERLATELTFARQVHEALFPVPIAAGPVRLAYIYEPAQELGGDFVFVHTPGSSSGALSAVLIDVTGHGVAAALAVNRLHGELQRLFAGDSAIAPQAVIEGLNRYACSSLAPQGVYATALCIQVDPTGEVRWSNAGHPSAMFCPARGAILELKPTSPMLGVLEGHEYPGTERRIDIAPGDAIIAFTDGVLEARNDRKREFGMLRVRQALASAAGQGPVGDLAAALQRAMESYRWGAPEDDTLIVEIRLASGA